VAWRNVNRKYLVCLADGSLSWSAALASDHAARLSVEPEDSGPGARLAFRTHRNTYLAVDDQGDFSCTATAVQKESMFEVVRPIETGLLYLTTLEVRGTLRSLYF
jgi:hypothetical protein